MHIQPVSYKRFFRCNNCLLLVYTIHLSLSTDLVGPPPPMGIIYLKHALCYGYVLCGCVKWEIFLLIYSWSWNELYLSNVAIPWELRYISWTVLLESKRQRNVSLRIKKMFSHFIWLYRILSSGPRVLQDFDQRYVHRLIQEAQLELQEEGDR